MFQVAFAPPAYRVSLQLSATRRRWPSPMRATASAARTQSNFWRGWRLTADCDGKAERRSSSVYLLVDTLYGANTSLMFSSITSALLSLFRLRTSTSTALPLLSRCLGCL